MLFVDLVRRSAGTGVRWPEIIVMRSSASAGSTRVVDTGPVSGLDAVIVTGTEPSGPSLNEDPTTPLVEQAMISARQSRVPVLFSCFAAHAALATGPDGVRTDVRLRMAAKHSGVFRHVVADPHHPLVRDMSPRPSVPHSRWNSLDQKYLLASGVSPVVVEESGQWHLAASVDGVSRVYLQGHPEYTPDTLYREYRRDVKRYLGRHQVSYPSLPYNYFTNDFVVELDRFRKIAEDGRRASMMSEFPPFRETAVSSNWRAAAVLFMRNWLDMTRSRRGES